LQLIPNAVSYTWAENHVAVVACSVLGRHQLLLNSITGGHRDVNFWW